MNKIKNKIMKNRPPGGTTAVMNSGEEFDGGDGRKRIADPRGIHLPFTRPQYIEDPRVTVPIVTTGETRPLPLVETVVPENDGVVTPSSSNQNCIVIEPDDMAAVMNEVARREAASNANPVDEAKIGQRARIGAVIKSFFSRKK